jgi:hypothetical protein
MTRKWSTYLGRELRELIGTTAADGWMRMVQLWPSAEGRKEPRAGLGGVNHDLFGITIFLRECRPYN